MESQTENTGLNKEMLRLTILYKGSANIKDKLQDDYMILNLIEESVELKRPETVVSAIVNFPEIKGRKAIFIHDLIANEEEAKKYMLKKIEEFADKREYDHIYINSGKQRKDFLIEQGFSKVLGKPMFKKEIV